MNENKGPVNYESTFIRRSSFLSLCRLLAFDEKYLGLLKLNTGLSELYIMALMECVPNFSEGRNREVITQITEAIREVSDIDLLHVDSGYSANRTVVTLVGSPSAAVEAAFQGIKMAAALVDMRFHEGTHPCIGATDVCPLIPISGISIQETVDWAHILAKRVAEELKIPVFLYEEAARNEQRKNLAVIRKGGYKNLASKCQSVDGAPDFGSYLPENASTGATVIGVRDYLLAYNVNLNTDNVAVAKAIASEVRTAGNQNALPALKAIGWWYEERKIAQVSMNLTHYRETGLHDAFETVKKAALKKGVLVTGSELIGLAPLQSLLDAGYYYVKKKNKYQKNQQNDATLIAEAINSLGLEDGSPFEPKKRILEYRMNENGMTE